MTIEDIKFFQTKEGLDLIAKYKDISDKDLEMKAFSFVKKGVPHYSYLITLLKLRRKAEKKFSRADKMFFDSISLEMATSERIASHIAERFVDFKKVADLTCGIGGNALFLAQKTKVLAVDISETSIEMAKENARVYKVDKNIDFRKGDAFLSVNTDIDAFFIDPMRAREGKTKTKSIYNSEPRIDEILPKIFKTTKNVCVKISPAFDYKEIEQLPENPELELISENNENKVALLWFGDLKKRQRTATMFSAGGVKSLGEFNGNIEIPIVDKFEKYIFEPNVAIIKAHLIDEVAKEYSMSKVNKDIAFLTKNSLKNVDKDKFRIFEIIKNGHFSVKNIKKDLNDLGLPSVSVISRGTPIKPEKLLKDLKVREGSDVFVVLTKLKDEKNYYFIVKKSN